MILIQNNNADDVLSKGKSGENNLSTPIRFATPLDMVMEEFGHVFI